MSLSLKPARASRRNILLAAVLLLFAQSVIQAHVHGDEALGADCVICTLGNAHSAASDQAPAVASIIRPVPVPALARTVLPAAPGQAPFQARAPPHS